MSEPIFEEKIIENNDWWHYKYHFKFIEINSEQESELYDWLLFNMEEVYGWQVLWDGVVISDKENAMAFKLRWL